jgi:ATP-binding cassette subfamily B protein
MNIPIKKYWSLLHKYLRTQWGKILILFVLLILKITLRLVNPQIISHFIDQALSGAPLNVLMQFSAAFLGVAVVTQALTVANVSLGETVAWTATNALRIDLLQHCLGLDMSFHKAQTPGELTERIDIAVDALSNFFSRFMVYILGNGLLAIGLLALMYRFGWLLGAVNTIYAIAGLYIMMRVRTIAIPHWTKLHDIRAQFYGFLGEQLEGTEDIRANGTQAYVLQRFVTFIRRWLPLDRNANLAAYSGWMMNAALVAVCECIAYGLAGYLFFSGRISIGTAYLIVEYSTLLYIQIAELRGQIADLQHAAAGIERIQTLFGFTSHLRDGQAASLPMGPLSVAFENVSFAYDDQVLSVHNLPSQAAETCQATVAIDELTPESVWKVPDDQTQSTADDTVLHDLSFKLNPGRVLGLLGRTGSGKTTMARLVLRLYDPTEGQIRVGDVPLPETTLRDIRQRVAMVTQEVQLFQASVRDNLSLFRPDTTDVEIVSVLQHLGLLDWLESLPDGLDTQLGSRGSDLSAGQAQLLAFARIFLANPDIVILDEASSILDPATEKLIENAIDMLFAKRTGIIIAHRLNTIQHADDILILENGHIREKGNRVDLAQDTTSHFYHLLQTGMVEVLA